MENTKNTIRTMSAAGGEGAHPEAGTVRDEAATVEVNGLEAERLRAEIETERDARLRLAAEYKNYRRRTEEQAARSADEGKRELLEQMLSIADDIERALADSSESLEPVAQGVRVIQRRLASLLEANGVEAFESEGELFDPERHEAFDVVATGSGRAGSVHKEMRRGYFWNGRLLRPALVIVQG